MAFALLTAAASLASNETCSTCSLVSSKQMHNQTSSLISSNQVHKNPRPVDYLGRTHAPLHPQMSESEWEDRRAPGESNQCTQPTGRLAEPRLIS